MVQPLPTSQSQTVASSVSGSAASLPVLKQLACPNCGSPLDLRNPTSQTLVCPRCNSYVGIGTETAEILGHGAKLPPPPIKVALGSKARLDGVDYFVLGRVLYEGWDPDPEEDEQDERWKWTEWLAASSDGRMTWFSYDNEEGFVIFKKLRLKEAFNPLSDREIPVGSGKKARVRERYPAKILGAEGELTWRATAGEKLTMIEGAGDGKKYSIQFTPEELEVYEGTPIDEATVAQTFGDMAWAERVRKQVSGQKLRGTLGLICIVFGIISIILAAVANGSGTLALSQDLWITNDAQVVQIPLEIAAAGRPMQVRVWLKNDIAANSSYDVEVSMISPDESEAFLFDLDFWHETGSDEDGPWTEKGYYGEDTFVPFQTGTHELEIGYSQPEAGDTTTVVPTSYPTMQLQVAAYKDRMFPGWFIVYSVITLVIGGALFLSGAMKVGWGPIIVILIIVIIVAVLIASGVDLFGFVSSILEEA
ncbi:MAG: DUF4178 domain-containing protein [Anaerolineae bacterium]|nr:DUF4178 domain-containing protein [Anaerolineae bacterium]